MRILLLLAGIGLAALGSTGCSVETRTPANDRAADARDGNGVAARIDENGIRIDLDGVRADIDRNGSDVRVDRDGVAVNINGREIEARVGTGEDPSVSVTTNRR